MESESSVLTQRHKPRETTPIDNSDNAQDDEHAGEVYHGPVCLSFGIERTVTDSPRHR